MAENHSNACQTVAALHQGEQGQITWLEDPPPCLRPAYRFASVIVWTENKNVTISDHFICFILPVKQSAALGPVFCGRRLKKIFFWGKTCTPNENPGYTSDSGWPGLRTSWPLNDLAPLLCWRRHWWQICNLTSTHYVHEWKTLCKKRLNRKHSETLECSLPCPYVELCPAWDLILPLSAVHGHKKTLRNVNLTNAQ